MLLMSRSASGNIYRVQGEYVLCLGVCRTGGVAGVFAGAAIEWGTPSEPS